MAGLVLCEPTELYNILNQSTKLSRLTEPNYLCLLDARTKREYNESHVITARRVKQNPMGEYLVPESVELECVKYCVVYDGKTSFLDDTYYDDYEEKEKDEKGTKAASETSRSKSSSSCSQNAEVGAAIQCARVLEQLTRHPVRILKGGYERFTACYHFLRTQKIFWMPQELDALQPYPVEILPGQLYMGDCRQACDQQIQKDLKIKAQVNISEEIATLFTDESKTLHVSVADSPDADLFSFFPTICHFIDAQMALGAVLVFSTLGLSRSSTAVMAFLMHSSHYPLKALSGHSTTGQHWSWVLRQGRAKGTKIPRLPKGAWKYIQKCKTNMRPNRGFVQQLSDWESQIYGSAITDISEPHY
ncbi:serine/threonine/tyrosine-interacting-like protein 1 isoform X1 [Caretta caretta]|uniref:serine/threonine/tyrosine-interacting-like protein 1 isoform X1 n=1 Tax=Caretta caretta TaxID=8467 RepID=UPI002095886F|nr:serine/threonine/tyrosine-interacting-like protein 1 isoform X1 [Caretta caretta]XP_048680054.1 serine/threonine/tyrosine-interacting-like protein 1 isoform X1 [Caretta caretta]XP_048680056.1 serine/threonine/tyrosine-interacting-like protein 1 isoform X1 [Caretta caretta]